MSAPSRLSYDGVRPHVCHNQDGRTPTGEREKKLSNVGRWVCLIKKRVKIQTDYSSSTLGLTKQRRTSEYFSEVASIGSQKNELYINFDHPGSYSGHTGWSAAI